MKRREDESVCGDDEEANLLGRSGPSMRPTSLGTSHEDPCSSSFHPSSSKASRAALPTSLASLASFLYAIPSSPKPSSSKPWATMQPRTTILTSVQLLLQQFRQQLGLVLLALAAGWLLHYLATMLWQQAAGLVVVSTEQGMSERNTSAECWSREEIHHFFKVALPQRSKALEARLKRFEETQRRCLDVLGVDFLWSSIAKGVYLKDTPGLGHLKGCRYVLWTSTEWAAAGHDVLTLVSAFLVALLTDRALVVPANSSVGRHLCHPVAGASPWTVSDKVVRDAFVTQNPLDILKELDKNHKSWDDIDKEHPQWMSEPVHLRLVNWHPSMFCEGFMQRLHSPPFVLVNGYEYVVPGFYLVPSMSEELNLLFPEGNVFQQLSRYLINPNNSLWTAVKQFYSAHLSHQRMRVGIEIEPRELPHPDDVSSRIFSCATQVSHYVPDPLSPTDSLPATAVPQEPNTTALLVAAYRPLFFDRLQKQFHSGKLEGGRVVTVYSVDTGSTLIADSDPAIKDLMNLFLLSFSDRLIITDWSVTGTVAAGLAGLPPFSLNIVVWIHKGLDYSKHNQPVCEAWMSEPCFAAADPNSLKCPEGGGSFNEGSQSSGRVCPGPWPAKGLSMPLNLSAAAVAAADSLH